MKILIVEDDHLQADWIHQSLANKFPRAEIERISTELEFRSRVDNGNLAENPPDVIIMDVMLRWTDPGPDLKPPPSDVREEGFFNAGLRCERLLAQEERTSHIPVILYTVLERTDLKQDPEKLRRNVHYLPKESNPEPLIQLIRDLTRQPQDS
jgi:CheY-like chemotaxis protein